jgi:hypothetical protein
MVVQSADISVCLYSRHWMHGFVLCSVSFSDYIHDLNTPCTMLYSYRDKHVASICLTTP